MGATPIRHFTDLVVWQEGHKLVLNVYSTTRKFPEDERYGLVSQMRRSASSITANIAEGFGRQGSKDKAQFYIHSRGSVDELQDQFLIAKDLKYITDNLYNELQEASVLVHKLLNGLIKSTRR